MPHDKQVVIAFLTGVPGEDKIIKSGVKLLAIKWRLVDNHSKSITPRPLSTISIHCMKLSTPCKKLQATLSALGPDSRLYIFGHGDWATNTCGGLTGKEVAKFLVENKLNKRIGLVSVISCDGAIGSEKSDPAAFISLKNTRFSFVHNLHSFLGDRYRIKTVCHGRIGSVSIGTIKEVPISGVDIVGRKETIFYDRHHKPIPGHPENWTSFQPKSKVVFYWERGWPKMTWAEDIDGTDAIF